MTFTENIPGLDVNLNTVKLSNIPKFVMDNQELQASLSDRKPKLMKEENSTWHWQMQPRNF